MANPQQYLPPGFGQQYSPYGVGGLYGLGDLSGLLNPTPTPSAEPGFNLQKSGLGQSLQSALATAAQARKDAGRQNTRNLASINTNAADRGDFFSGDRLNLRSQQGQDYQSTLNKIAQDVSKARASYRTGLGGLNLENANYLAQYGQQPTPLPLLYLLGQLGLGMGPQQRYLMPQGGGFRE